MDLGLNGRVALVAAASRGLGKAVATALAEEGARVAMFARRQEAIEAAAAEVRRRSGAEVLPLEADVNRPEDLERVVKATVDRFGRLDVLINNAGGPPPGTFDTLTEEQWQQAVNLTLMSAVRLTRLALPHLRTQGGGRIINLTSSSTREPIPNLMLSNAHRISMINAFKTIARQVAADGVTLNTVLPGRIDTDRLIELLGSHEAAQALAAEEVPAGRLGTVEEFAAIAVLLCSARAGYVTGETVAVDGGLLRSVF